ncbi:MAG: primosomal protein N' [Candidatus Xenolissoclinum pacificiensis L6]|uniref:Replication restart protein PriA n=1 Tax=Candidatus Xenolissoclinum pacificiensis L6 TaxID=1401685 RepID=W2UZL7_9RICK|nr:MAG: primosomal protein N' [Candidatus Xenolissoclinum pacificiensis L6]
MHKGSHTFYYEIIVPFNVKQSFTYLYECKIEIGTLVEVEFNKRKSIGIILCTVDYDDDQAYKVQSILQVLPLPRQSKEFLSFLIASNTYNFIAIGKVFQLSVIRNAHEITKLIWNKDKIPKSTVQKKLCNILLNQSLYNVEIKNEYGIQQRTIDNALCEGYLSLSDDSITECSSVTIIRDYVLSSVQNDVFNNMKTLLHQFSPIVLDGVTGSGKTLIFFAVIEYILLQDSDAQLLILIPEIALIVNIIKRIQDALGFGDDIMIAWHSGLTESQRRINWQKIVVGTARVIIGARSAVFLPYKNLKLIIVDEEHDSSYKQTQTNFSYHGRDMAILRAKIFSIPIILSSATPSLESIYNIKHKGFYHFKIQERFNEAQFPKIESVNMKTEPIRYLSRTLIENIKITLEKQQQVILFANKRGFSPCVLCKECKMRMYCPNCSVLLTYHKGHNIVLCHFCYYSAGFTNRCVSCKTDDSLIMNGLGIEKISQEIHRLFPDVPHAIISSDSKNLVDTIAKVENNSINIVIGTQIIAKGYNFPNLSLIGILDIENNIYNCDFRYLEKNFQLLYQLIGRAGRVKGIEGKVILQSYQQENILIRSIINHDRDLLYKHELLNREKHKMPPYYRITSIIVRSPKDIEAYQKAIDLIGQFPKRPDIQILGPIPAPVSKIKNLFRYSVLLKYKASFKIQQYLQEWAVYDRNIIYVIDPIDFI